LRFPEFEGEWEKFKLENCLLRLENGMTYDSMVNEGEYPVSRIETISNRTIDYSKVGYTSEGDRLFHYKMERGDILFSHINSLKHIGKTAYYYGDQPLYHGMNLLLMRCNTTVLPMFLYQLMNSSKFIRKCQILANQAVNQASINTGELRKTSIYIPVSEEQQKIARLLYLLDKRIETQNKIIEKLESLIKGLSNLFFCEQENKPSLRFPQYYEEWKKVELKEIVSRITRRNKENETELALTIAAKYGLVDQISFFNKQIASVDLSSYYLLYHGEFAYNKSYSKDYPWGAVKRLDAYEKGVLSTLYICFKPKDYIISDFFVHYFETNKWYRGISEIAGEGARNHGLLNISIDDYFDTTHYLPSFEEQKKIASFLNLLCIRLDKEKAMIQAFESQKR
jgi:Restriction endonuclease S subunits